MYKFFIILLFFLLFFSEKSVLAQPVIISGNQHSSAKSTESQSEKWSSSEKEGKSEKEISLLKNNKIQKDNGSRFDINRSDSPDTEKITGNSTSAPVIVNLHVRETDIYKSPVVAKYFSHENLLKIKLNKPEKIDQIGFYFNKSFLFELLPSASDQGKIDDFISRFDPAVFETQRKPDERSFIDNEDAGVKVILLAEAELPFKIPEKFKNQERKETGCENCAEGKGIPKNADALKNKK